MVKVAAKSGLSLGWGRRGLRAPCGGGGSSGRDEGRVVVAAHSALGQAC